MNIFAGIDPSMTETGVFTARRDGFGKATPLGATCIKTKAGDPLRLTTIRTNVQQMLQAAGPAGPAGIVGIETNYAHGGKSMRTALEQREAIGVCIEAAEAAGWTVERVTPSQGKKALSGHGGADKPAQVLHAFRLFPGLDDNKPLYWRKAVADAIGIAIAAERIARCPA